MSKICTWTTDIEGINWYTECGYAYFPLISNNSYKQPNISNTDICPWCKRKRIEDKSNYLENLEDYEEDED